MVGTPAIRNLIREDKVAQMYSAIQTGQQYGMMTLDQHLQDLVKRSLITRNQAREYAKDKRLFVRRAQRARAPVRAVPCRFLHRPFPGKCPLGSLP
jgi:Tfp pilus assembly pilus retraction ATPase PilT